MKKNARSVIAGLMLTAAIAAIPQIASATVVDISHAPVALTLIDNTLNFGAKFGANQKNNTFADNFTFSIGSDFRAVSIVSSISSNAANGLALTSFDLFNAAGALVVHGVQQSVGVKDVWFIPETNLHSGSYALRVQGYVVSNGSGSFGGNVNITPVPEPETYGMMLFGLGALAMIARRKKHNVLN